MAFPSFDLFFYVRKRNMDIKAVLFQRINRIFFNYVFLNQKSFMFCKMYEIQIYSKWHFWVLKNKLFLKTISRFVYDEIMHQVVKWLCL